MQCAQLSSVSLRYSTFAISSDGNRNSGCYKQPGSTSREAKMLKGECWAGWEPGGHFSPTCDMAEVVQYIAEKLLSILLITNSFEGRKARWTRYNVSKKQALWPDRGQEYVYGLSKLHLLPDKAITKKSLFWDLHSTGINWNTYFTKQAQ